MGEQAPVDFGKLFLDQEADDEDATSVADALHSLKKIMGDGPFKAADVAGAVNDFSRNEDADVVLDFLFPDRPRGVQVPAKAIGKRLKAHVGEPVRYGGGTMTLKTCHMHDKVHVFHIVSSGLSGETNVETWEEW
jgi:hypothetical protein